METSLLTLATAAQPFLKADKSVMDIPSPRFLRRDASQRSQLNPPVPLRRSTRLQPEQCPLSTSQSLPKQQLSDPETTYTFIPNLESIKSLVSQEVQLPGILSDLVEETSKSPSKVVCLTRRNLRAFEKMTEKHSTTKSSVNESSSGIESTTGCGRKTVSTTDAEFPRAAWDNGVYPLEDAIPPNNFTSIQNRVKGSRDSLSPPESDFPFYKGAIQSSDYEDTLIEKIKFRLLKEYQEVDKYYIRVTSQLFTAFPKNVGFNNSLSPAKPDTVEGFKLSKWKGCPNLKSLGGAAAPFQGTKSTVLVHIAGEWKAPGKDMARAQTQAMYAGASLVYGSNQALKSIGRPDLPDHAYVMTFAIDGKLLEMFAQWSTESLGVVEYHMYEIASVLLTASYEDYIKGRKWLRNLQDLAKENSENLNDRLKVAWGGSLKRTRDRQKNGEGSDKGNGSENGSLANISTPGDSISLSLAKKPKLGR